MANEREYIEAVLNHSPNTTTGWIPFHTARDIYILASDEFCHEEMGFDLPLYDEPDEILIATELAQMRREGLVRAKMVHYGPSVVPRDQLTYSWTESTHHPDHQKMKEWGPKIARELQRCVKKGEELLGRMSAN